MNSQRITNPILLVVVIGLTSMLIYKHHNNPPIIPVAQPIHTASNPAPGNSLTSAREVHLTVTTHGNFSFIDLYTALEKGDTVSSTTNEALEALEGFENQHPELNVVSFDIQSEKPDGAPSHIAGVWIYHRPKQIPAAK